MVEQVLHAAGCGCDEIPGALTRARREIHVGIALVAAGAARTVRIANLPAAEHAAAEGVAAAQSARVAMRIVRDGRSAPLVVIGPRLDA